MTNPPGDFVRCSINASLPGGESMTHTFWVKEVLNELPGAGRYDDAAYDRLAAGVRDKWTTFLTSPAPPVTYPFAYFLSTETIYSTVSVYKIEDDGKASYAATAAFGTTAKGSQNGALPTEVALCASIHTTNPGKSGRGRMFLGGFTGAAGYALGSQGRTTTDVRLAATYGLARFFRQVRDIEESQMQDLWEPQVVSLTKGIARKIERVSVGDVFDVQRSRRASLIEARVSAGVDAAG